MFRCTAMLLLVVVVSGPALAQDSLTKKNSVKEQGGSQSVGANVQKVGRHQIATEISDRGIVFRLMDDAGASVAIAEANGKVELNVQGSDKVHSLELKSLKDGRVAAAVNLSRVLGKKLNLKVEIESKQTGALRFAVSGMVNVRVPDSMLILLQQTCLVSGKDLGSMGDPVKVVVDGKPLFVCCDGCLTRAKSYGADHLTKYYGSNRKEVRDGVFQSNMADATAIVLQKNCPVMDEPLGSMGVPQKVNVQGKAVYICCAGCSKKLKADPQRYLKKLGESGVQPPSFD